MDPLRPALPIGNGIGNAERETIIRISDDEESWDVYTSSPKWYRRISKIADALGIEPTLAQGGARFTLPTRCVSLRKPVVLSDEERAKRRNAAIARFAPKTP
jgi:hypothetical protein